jgi:hypothetical protein
MQESVRHSLRWINFRFRPIDTPDRRPPSISGLAARVSVSGNQCRTRHLQRRHADSRPSVPMMPPTILPTDLYELTMLEAYFAQRMNGTDVFELFVRTLPAQRNFLLTAGLAHVMRSGRLVAPLPTLAAIGDYASTQLARLPERLRGCEVAEPNSVEVSAATRAPADEVDART